MAEPAVQGGKRVKWYVLNNNGKWDDRGTGHVCCKKAASSLQVHFQREDSTTSCKLITVNTDTEYELQGKTIISWTDKSSDPLLSNEMALSFAEARGCTEIWDNIRSWKLRQHAAAAAAIATGTATESSSASGTATATTSSPANANANANMNATATATAASNYDGFLKISPSRTGTSSGAGSSARPGGSTLLSNDEDAKPSKLLYENGDSHWATGEVSDEAFADSGNMMMLATSAAPFSGSSATQEVFPAKLEMPAPDKDGLNDLVATLTDPTLAQKASLRDRICAELTAGNYVARLCALFSKSEKEGDIEALSKLYLVMRSMCMLGNHPLVEVLANHQHLVDVIGCLEYDPVSVHKMSQAMTDVSLESQKDAPSASAESVAMDLSSDMSEGGKVIPEVEAAASNKKAERAEEGVSNNPVSSTTDANGTEQDRTFPGEEQAQTGTPNGDPATGIKPVSLCIPDVDQKSKPSHQQLPGTPRPGDSPVNFSSANPLTSPATPRIRVRPPTISDLESSRLPGTPRPSGHVSPFVPDAKIPNLRGTSGGAIPVAPSTAGFSEMPATPRPDSQAAKSASPGTPRLYIPCPIGADSVIPQLPGTPRPHDVPDMEAECGNSQFPGSPLHDVSNVRKSASAEDGQVHNASDADSHDPDASPSVDVKIVSDMVLKDETPSGNPKDGNVTVTDSGGATKMNPKFVPLRKHRDFLQNKVSFKAVAKISNPEIVNKIHQNFQVGYIKDVILSRILDDCYNNSFGMLVSFNNVDILLYFLHNCMVIRELFRKVIGFFQLRSKKRDAPENADGQKSPKRPRFCSSSSSKESATSIQQMSVDNDNDARPMEAPLASEENIPSAEKDGRKTMSSVCLVQEISDAINFSIQLCEIARNQGTLRPQFYTMLRSCGVLDVSLHALKDRLPKIRLLGSNLLSIVAMQDYSELRTHIVKAVDDEAGPKKISLRASATKSLGIHLRSAKIPVEPQKSKTPASSVVTASKSTQGSGDAKIAASSLAGNTPRSFTSKTSKLEDSKDVSPQQKPSEKHDTLPGEVVPSPDADIRNEQKPSVSIVEEESTEVSPECSDKKSDPSPVDKNTSGLPAATSSTAQKRSGLLKLERPEYFRRRMNQVSTGVKALPRTEANSLYPLLATMVDVACTDDDIGVVLQVVDLLRGLLDPTTMRADVARETFVGVFYTHFADRLLEPIVQAGVEPQLSCNKQKTSSFHDENVPYLCDFLSYGVANHSFIFKYFVVTNNVGGKVVKLLRHKKKYIRLAGVRFIRTCIAMRDKAYDEYLLRNNLLMPIMEMYRENSHGDNLISSAVLDLVDYVTKASRGSLLEVIVEKFADILEPSSVLCATFETAKTALRTLKHKRANGSGSVASDASLMNDLALASEGRLELNGVDQMVSLLAQQSDGSSPFESSSGRHGMNIFGNELRLPTMESGDAVFPANDELYTSFPELLEEKDAAGPVAMATTDMWLENNPVEPGASEDQELSCSAKDESTTDSNVILEDDSKQRGANDEIMQAETDVIPNQAGPEDVRIQAETKTNCVELSVVLNAAQPCTGGSNADYARDQTHETKMSAERDAELSPGAAPECAVVTSSQSARIVEDESKHKVVAEDDSESVAKRVRSAESDKAPEKDTCEGEDCGSPRSSPTKKRRSPQQDDVGSPTKKKRMEDIGMSTKTDTDR